MQTGEKLSIVFDQLLPLTSSVYRNLDQCPLIKQARDGRRKMSQTELARRLGVSRLSVSELLLEKRALSADMAVRLGKLTNTAPESWLRMQSALDLWELEQNPKRYRNIEPVAA